MMGIQDIGAASYLLYFNLTPQTTSPTGVVDRYGGDSQPNKGESAAHTVRKGNRYIQPGDRRLRCDKNSLPADDEGCGQLFPCFIGERI